MLEAFDIGVGLSRILVSECRVAAWTEDLMADGCELQKLIRNRVGSVQSRTDDLSLALVH